ncbi:MAG: hypothetical protein WCO06_00690 [Candidatus Roizmanbacteria bacterium]
MAKHNISEEQIDEELLKKRIEASHSEGDSSEGDEDDLSDVADNLDEVADEVVINSTTVRVVEKKEPKYASPNAEKAMSIMNIESNIQRYMMEIEKLKEEMKMNREMFTDAVTKDAGYHELDQQVKDLNKQKTTVKQRIMKQPAVALVVDKMGAIKEEIKSADEMLSGYLQEYQKETGLDQIVTEDGTVLEIINVTKVVRRVKGKE